MRLSSAQSNEENILISIIMSRVASSLLRLALITLLILGESRSSTTIVRRSASLRVAVCTTHVDSRAGHGRGRAGRFRGP